MVRSPPLPLVKVLEPSTVELDKTAMQTPSWASSASDSGEFHAQPLLNVKKLPGMSYALKHCMHALPLQSTRSAMMLDCWVWSGFRVQPTPC